MSPTIIKPRSTPGMQLYTKMKLHQATDDVEDTVETKRVMDPIHNWFFNPEKENYSHKVIDFANARYQPTTVDIRNDTYYRTKEDANELSTTTDSSLTLNTPPTSPSELQQAPTAKEIARSQSEPRPQASPTQTLHMPSNDHQIESRRKKLKDLLTPTPDIDSMSTLPNANTSTPAIKQVSIDTPSSLPQQQTATRDETQKRDDFKKLFAQQQTPVQTQEPAPVDPRQRNVLKEFLAANPSLAHAKDHGLEGQRKAEA
jgi:hypothetical protein